MKLVVRKIKKKLLYICVMGYLLNGCFLYSMNHNNTALSNQLMWAFKEKEVDIQEIKKLIKEGADINAQDSCGETPLVKACNDNIHVLAKLLIEEGADVNYRDKNCNTPLLWACCCRNKIEIVKLLLEKGADVNASDNYGNTPLLWACYRGDQALVELLVKEGADVRAKDSSGNTPLIIARKKKHRGLITFFLERWKVDREFELSKMEKCSICLNKFEDGKKVSVTLCSHFYCSDCLDSWIKESNSCPLCRTIIEKKSITTKASLK